MAQSQGVLRGLEVGALASAGAAAVFPLGGWLAGLPSAPYLLFEWLVRVLPGRLLAGGIDTMVGVLHAIGVRSTDRAAKVAEAGMAVVSFVLLGALLGGGLAAVSRNGRRAWGGGILLGLLLFLALVAIDRGQGHPAGAVASVLWLGGVSITWGAVMGRLIGGPGPTPATTPSPSRRVWLYTLATGAVSSLVALLWGGRVRRSQRRANRAGAPAPPLDTAATSGPAASPPRAELAARFAPAAGTRPELTPSESFYRIDINIRPPDVDAASWRLTLDGLVDRPRTLSLDELRARPSVTQAITLECISNPVAGDLIGTALWTGVPVRDLLREAGLRPGVQAIQIEALDGFHESVPLAEALDPRTLLVHTMNGQPLTAEHGFPLRIYIPNHYGMKQPKWIHHVSAADRARDGYWVERGWSRDATPQTTAVIDTVAPASAASGTATALVGGIAYAGARGINRVEIQVDDSPWAPAELRTPPLSPLTWVQWRFRYTGRPGRHVFRARAYDGQDKLQPTQPAPPHPSGATGIHALTRVVGASGAG